MSSLDVEINDHEDDDRDETFECWCGASGTYDELCNVDGLQGGCGGTGTIYCMCGGDLCVCHHHGEQECFGCPDCGDDNDEPIDLENFE